MANRVTPFTNIETLSGNISAATYFDNNIGPAFSALNDASLGYVNAISTDSGSANNYVVTCAYGVPSAYNPGFFIQFIPANTNTGASVITVNGVTPAQSIVDAAGTALLPNSIVAGVMATIVYINGAYRLLTLTNSGKLVVAYTPSAAGTITVNCGSYNSISISLDATNAPNSAVITMLLQNVSFGAHIDLTAIPAAGGQLLKFANNCSDQAGGTISKITTWDATDGNINLITTGWSFSGALHYSVFEGHLFNSSLSGSQLHFLDGFN